MQVERSKCKLNGQNMSWSPLSLLLASHSLPKSMIFQLQNQIPVKLIVQKNLSWTSKRGNMVYTVCMYIPYGIGNYAIRYEFQTRPHLAPDFPNFPNIRTKSPYLSQNRNYLISSNWVNNFCPIILFLPDTKQDIDPMVSILP